MPNRYNASASARIAIPLAAALVVAIVLPAVLLHARDPGTLPIAAPAASEHRTVHTQTVAKPAPKHHATRPHVTRTRHAAIGSSHSTGRHLAPAHHVAPVRHARPHAHGRAKHDHHARKHAPGHHHAKAHPHPHPKPHPHRHAKHHPKGKR